MTHTEFFAQLNRLCQSYEVNIFPPERVSILFERYKSRSVADFQEAVTWLILTLPPPAQIFAKLDEKMKDSERETSVNERQEMYQPAPNAAELAAKYAPAIIEMLKRGPLRELPYDPKERIK